MENTTACGINTNTNSWHIFQYFKDIQPVRSFILFLTVQHQWPKYFADLHFTTGESHRKGGGGASVHYTFIESVIFKYVLFFRGR